MEKGANLRIAIKVNFSLANQLVNLPSHSLIYKYLQNVIFFKLRSKMYARIVMPINQCKGTSPCTLYEYRYF